MDADLLTSLPSRLHRDKFPGLGETASSAEAAHAECHKAVALGCEGLAPCCGRMYRNGVWHAERHFIYIILTYDSIQICKYHLFLVTLLMQSNKRSVSPHNVNTPAFVITATLPFPLQQKPTLPFQKGHPQPLKVALPFAQRGTDPLPKGVRTFCPKGCEPFAQRGTNLLPKGVRTFCPKGFGSFAQEGAIPCNIHTYRISINTLQSIQFQSGILCRRSHQLLQVSCQRKEAAERLVKYL